MSTGICAREGCDRPLPRRHPGQAGRPPIYCSPSCRASWVRSPVLVEVDRCEDNDGFITGEWIVRLRHGHRVVVIGSGLGRFSADMLANELRAFLDGGSVGVAS